MRIRDISNFLLEIMRDVSLGDKNRFLRQPAFAIYIFSTIGADSVADPSSAVFMYVSLNLSFRPARHIGNRQFVVDSLTKMLFLFDFVF